MKGYQKAGMLGLLAVALLGTAGCGKKAENVFQPKLDTEAKVELNCAGFFGNFEALDQVTNDFNRYYPNVEFTYEQVSSENYDSYLEANPEVDIMMTSQEMFGKFGDILDGFCADLSKEDINLADIEENMLQMEYHNGKLSAIPMGQNIYGLIVNVSLLEKEGLSVPADYEEFIQVLTALKEKGYTPIQGPESKVYAELTQGMLYDMLLADPSLYEDLLAGKESAVDQLMPVMDKLNVIIENGFTDMAVNQTYPNDNYDQAILTFFEGNVPFWVCNTEKVSGMKKRESKSEAFQANPFVYDYIYAPLGEKGPYVYAEPWFGFAVNKNSPDYEYAIEFIRFLATREEINKMADVKGIPSVAVEKTDVEIYRNVLHTENAEMSYVNKGEITTDIVTNWYACVNGFASGKYTTEEEALKAFVAACSGQ